MKRKIGMFLALVMLISCLSGISVPVSAAEKATKTRAIAIVFDNSGSMYLNGNMAWCRATYAIEVFASMLNEGDELSIYPMNEIEVNGSEYSMTSPLIITDTSDAKIVESILSTGGGNTPIESISYAAEGLKKSSLDEKHLIVLTDGASFYKKNTSNIDIELNKSDTIQALDDYFNMYSGEEINVIYLGIGNNVAVPTKEEDDYFSKVIASDSTETLQKLTYVCNRVFGRDVIPESYKDGNKFEFDISLKKLIVFVQGKDISNVSVDVDGTKVSSIETKYSEAGASEVWEIPDTSLQGMIVTYENCNKKEEYTYTISYTGEATSIEVYYEPNADLVLQFKNEDGIMVDNGNLYDGEYTIYYALRDNITGGYVDSPLIGTPKYSGEITINGSAEPLRNEGTASEGKNGKQTIHLSADDQFSAIVEVEYLSGYKSKKTLKDFGWDSDPITISSRVPGELRLELSGTGKTYYIPTLEQGDPVEARVYYEGRLLTGDELESVVITWAESLSGAYLDKVFCGDHYDIIFSHKTDNPTDTIPGESNFPMKALYKPDGCIEAESEPVDFYYTIEDCESALSSDLSIPSKYICISELDESKEIKIDLLLNGQKLSEEQMSRTSLVLDTGGIEYTVKPDDSGYLVKLRKTEGIKSGKYEIKYSASYEDEIGRVSVTEDKGKLELGVLQPWVKWAIALAGLLLLAIIIFLICRIKALPTKIQSRKSDSNLSVDGEDVSKNAGFSSHVSKSGFETYVSYAGKKFGLRANVRPAKDSYLATPQKKRKADADGASVQKFGATILEATIGTARFVLNEETRKFEQTPPSKKPFTIRNGQTIRYSGIINSSGVDRQFSVSTRLSTKK